VLTPLGAIVLRISRHQPNTGAPRDQDSKSPATRVTGSLEGFRNMPLGVLKLDHFADSIALLELECVVCDKHRTLRTDELVAKHTRFVAIPELKQIGMPDCPRGRLRCRARFPQLERLFAGARRERRHNDDEQRG
jgi:hypothetical protein